MTSKELIDLLQRCDPDGTQRVLIFDADSMDLEDITGCIYGVNGIIELCSDDS